MCVPPEQVVDQYLSADRPSAVRLLIGQYGWHEAASARLSWLHGDWYLGDACLVDSCKDCAVQVHTRKLLLDDDVDDEALRQVARDLPGLSGGSASLQACTHVPPVSPPHSIAFLKGACMHPYARGRRFVSPCQAGLEAQGNNGRTNHLACVRRR